MTAEVLTAIWWCKLALSNQLRLLFTHIKLEMFSLVPLEIPQILTVPSSSKKACKVLLLVF